METKCPVAEFIAHRIQVMGKPQSLIAREVGFDKPNMITMIKQGRTRLPMAKVSAIASALETDPVALIKLCLMTYYPDNWKTMEPLFESALTVDELAMVKAWRAFVRVPYLVALTEEQRDSLSDFLVSLREAPQYSITH